MATNFPQVVLSKTDGSTIYDPATTGTQSNVAASASPVTVLASNVNRKGAAFYNDSSVVCYLLVGSGTVASTLFTVMLQGGQYYELPTLFGGVPTVIVTGIWASASGTMRVTEWT